jgi:hypothetical protein
VLKRAHHGQKDGKSSFWLPPKDYEAPEFAEAWARIGYGAPSHSVPDAPTT